jgi:integration host factor subunit beta
MKMKKTDFIEIISDNCKLPRSESKRSIEVILEQLSVAIVSGKGVEIRGFGGFYKRHRESRIGINPKTGEKTQVEEKSVPFFKPGKRLKNAANNG